MRNPTAFAYSVCCIILFSSLGAEFASAQSASTQKTSAKRDMSKAEHRILTSKDGLPIHTIYWGSELGRESPVIIHLHGNGGSSRDFPVPFIELLHRAGYAQILVDIRGHGQSKGGDLTPEEKKHPTIQRLESGKLKYGDYQDIVTLDLEQVKQFIYNEHQSQYLNMNRTGVVALEMSAPLASAFAMMDWQKQPYEDSPDPMYMTPRGQDLLALVFISPTGKTGNFSFSDSLHYLRNPELGISFLFVVGETDRFDNGLTQKYFNSVSSNGKYADRVGLLKIPQPLRGAELLGKKTGVEEQILSFFDKRLKNGGVEWRDRQSRLDKKKKNSN